MNFAVIFLILASAMVFAWRRERRLVHVLFTVAMVLTVALYLHHATSKLPLSF